VGFRETLLIFERILTVNHIELLESQARWTGAAIFGCDFPCDFKEEGGTTLINRQIDCKSRLAGSLVGFLTSLLLNSLILYFRVVVYFFVQSSWNVWSGRE